MSAKKVVSNPASALGEAVGKVFEDAVVECLKQKVGEHNCTIRPERMVNGTGNTYQIDAVVFDSDGSPVILIDPKYIRYTKHNRDKVSWLCVAHYNLRKTYPTIRKSIAVLAGRWSEPSKALLRSFGVEIFEAPFEHLVGVLDAYGIDFDWPEKNRDIPQKAFDLWQDLDEETKAAMGENLVELIEDDLQEAVDRVLDVDLESLPARLSEIEVLLKSDRGEIVLQSFDTIVDAVQAMTALLSDKPDISEFLSSG